MHDAARRVTLTVLGNCLATDGELRAALAAVPADPSAARGWHGSYVSVISTQTQTLVLGDLSGFTSIYYAESDSGWLWSTAATPLAARIGAEFDFELLLLELVAMGFRRFLGATPFIGVRAVEPGWMLRLNSFGVSTARWHEPITTDSFENTQVFACEYLLDGLQRRATDSAAWSSDNSGGVDSGSATALGAMYRKITAITFQNQWFTRADLRNAKLIAQSNPRRINRILLQMPPGQIYFRNPSEVGLTSDLPGIYAKLAGALSEIAAVANRAGSDTHLSGEVGDVTWGRNPQSVVDLYRLDPLAALRQVPRLSRRTQCGPAHVATRLIRAAHTSYPTQLEQLAHRIQRSQFAQNPLDGYFSSCTTMPGVRWLTPDAAKALTKRLLTHATSVADELPGRQADWFAVHNSTSQMGAARAAFEAQGIIFALPYADDGMLAACLALRGDLRQPPDTYKPLITTGPLAQRLPEAIVGRRSKGDYGACLTFAAMDHEERLLRVPEESPLVTLGWLDRSAVHNGFLPVTLGHVEPDPSFELLVVFTHWLETLKTGLYDWWEEN